jgi:hypothetical protein
MNQPHHKQFLRRHEGAFVQSTLTVCIVVLAFVALCEAARVDRIDIYDKSDNHLLFVTFDYDSTGANTGRSVFASDSTFLRSTTFQPSGTAVKENSIDFNGSLVFSTTRSPSTGGNASFSTIDQFGMDQFGGPMSFSLASSNNYTVTQNGQLSCTEQYQIAADGTLNRITILDKTGSLMYYAIASPVTAISVSPSEMPKQPVLAIGNRGIIKARFNLVRSSHVCLEIYTCAGRKAAGLIDKIVSGGSHELDASVPGPGGKGLGNGAYIVRLTIDGTAAVSNKMLLQR